MLDLSWVQMVTSKRHKQASVNELLIYLKKKGTSEARSGLGAVVHVGLQ